MFQCHQSDADSSQSRICAGWAGCHGEGLLGLRISLFRGRIDGAAFHAAAGYRSPVPLFGSGNEAADHGQADMVRPAAEATHLIDKINRTRGDLKT